MSLSLSVHTVMCACEHRRRRSRRRVVADIEAIIIGSDPMCHCCSVCLRPEMKTERCHITMLEVIDLLEGEREGGEQ